MYSYFLVFVTAMLGIYLMMQSLYLMSRHTTYRAQRSDAIIINMMVGVVLLVATTFLLFQGLNGEYARVVRDIFLPIQIYCVIAYMVFAYAVIILSNPSPRSAARIRPKSSTPRTDDILATGRTRAISAGEKLKAIEEVIGVHPEPFSSQIGPHLVKSIIKA